MLNDTEVADCIANVEGFDQATVQYEIDGCAEDMRVSSQLELFPHSVSSFTIILKTILFSIHSG